jgi:FkbM family methyltransferase
MQRNFRWRMWIAQRLVNASSIKQKTLNLSRLRQNYRQRLARYAEITGLPPFKSAAQALKCGLSAIPKRLSRDYLLEKLDIQECDRVADNLVRIKLANGRIFFGHRSEAKQYRLFSMLQPHLPEIVTADAYKLALDIQNRYCSGLRPPFNAGGDYIEGGCFTGLKAIGWHDTIRGSHRIFAVEIGKSNFDIMKLNIEANGLSDIIFPIHAGLWRETGEGVHKHAFTTRRFLERTDRWSGHMTNDEPTKLISLDALLETCAIEVAAFLNIQVNGAEIEVLKGLSRLDRVKIIRVAAYYGQGNTRNVDVVRQMLTDAGCTILRETKLGSLTAVTPGWKHEYRSAAEAKTGVAA